MEAVFKKYDTDKSGTLEGPQIINLLEDALKQFKKPRKVSQEEVDRFLKEIDKNHDGKISKDELMDVFRLLASKNSPLK